jgi:DNA-directed RNA polymerase specialized sigma24 family protein
VGNGVNAVENAISNDGGIKVLNWVKIYEALFMEASFLARHLPDVFNAGVSAADVVQKVFVEFLSSNSHCGWDPKKIPVGMELEQGLICFLGKILHRRMMDEMRANTRRMRTFPIALDANRTSNYAAGTDQKNSDVLRQMADQSRSAESDMQFKDLCQQLKLEACGDKVIERLIDRADQVAGGGQVNKEFSATTGDSTADIRAARRRFTNMLRATGRFDKWKKTLSS